MLDRELEEIACNFRRAIEAAKKNHERGIFFDKFPVGQCGNTSDILAQYLIDNKIGPVTYVNGTYYYDDDSHNRNAHTWLFVRNNVIDITGDQFKDYGLPLFNDIPVYVGAMTDYYKLFEIGPGGKYEHHGLQTQWSNYSELLSWYETILEYL